MGGADVSGFAVGNEVYGLTNNHFTGGHAESALASAMQRYLLPNK
jgi:hypothetical protein